MLIIYFIYKVQYIVRPIILNEKEIQQTNVPPTIIPPEYFSVNPEIRSIFI
jgi:hypothetical protein